jgi:hypothetical protein
MDPTRFDRLTRAFGMSSCRHAVRFLAGNALGALLARRGLEPASATHGCRHTGAGCTKPGQCCSGRCAGNDTCQLCTRASQLSPTSGQRAVQGARLHQHGQVRGQEHGQGVIVHGLVGMG